MSIVAWVIAVLWALMSIVGQLVPPGELTSDVNPVEEMPVSLWIILEDAERPYEIRARIDAPFTIYSRGLQLTMWGRTHTNKNSFYADDMPYTIRIGRRGSESHSDVSVDLRLRSNFTVQNSSAKPSITQRGELRTYTSLPTDSEKVVEDALECQRHHQSDERTVWGCSFLDEAANERWKWSEGYGTYAQWSKRNEGH